MSENLILKSKVLSMFDYQNVDLEAKMPSFQPNYDQLDRDIERIRRAHGIIEEKEIIEKGDMVVLSCQSSLEKFNKNHISIYVGKNLFSQELENKLIGKNKGEIKLEIDSISVDVIIHKIQHTTLLKLCDETVKSWNIKDILSVDDLKRYCMNKQIDAFRDEDEDADILISSLFSQIMEQSQFDLDEDELELVQRNTEKRIKELKKGNKSLNEDNQQFDFDQFISKMMISNLKGAAIGCQLCEKENQLLTIDDYMSEINKRIGYLHISIEEAMKDYTQVDFMIDRYSEYYFFVVDKYVGDRMKEFYNSILKRRIYDVAIIGSGPAGLSAALNFKLHNKDMIWFGTPQLSDKVEKSEKIANYPGLGMISGKELNAHFAKQINDMGIQLTDKMVTDISKTRRCYMLVAENEIYEARTVLLATGLANVKGFKNEQELLGKGVSYCATCDGFLYKDKTIAIYCGSKRYEHEVEYLAEIAKQVYLYTPYKDTDIHLSNVKRIDSPIYSICGQEHVDAIELKNGSKLEIDGIFIIRTAVAPTALLKGIEMNGNSIAVDRNMATNKVGCYAAGDCTGRPYQITKAVGEGNIAAHSIIEYLSQNKEETKHEKK